jgi:V/A-type H+-transporting ATPase subunit E
MDKLQELTQKLYQEGLTKGKEEGEAIVAAAKQEAAAIVKKAEEEAAAIVEKAKKEAESHRIKVEGDVKMASQEALQTTRAAIENMLVASAVEKPVTDALSSDKFIKDIITEVAKKFSAQESADLALVLPESLKAGLEPFVKGELAKLVGKGIEATFSRKIGAGFKIGPKDGSYFISLTDESFQALIGEYLRPATKQLLFG